MSQIGPQGQPPYFSGAGGAGGKKSPESLPENALPSALPPSGGTVGRTTGAFSSSTMGAASLPVAVALSPSEWLMVLRNLLQLPKEITQLLAMLNQADPSGTQALLQQLLQEPAVLSLEDLQALLQAKVGQAQDKLLKLSQSSPLLAQSSEEFPVGAFLQQLTELSQQVKHSPAEALHSTLSLYLPYYPLHPPQAFSLRFESPEQDGEASEDNPNAGGQTTSVLVLLVETIHLGTLKVSIFPEGVGACCSVIEHDPSVSGLLASLMPVFQAFQQTMPAFVLPVLSPRSGKRSGQAVASATEPVAVQEGMGKREKRQSVGVHPSGQVSLAAVQLASLLIRWIFEADNRLGLLTSGEAEA